ncbi:MAG: TetR/AcrR family transcriptional regulator [Chthoniobacterales bacterium]
MKLEFSRLLAEDGHAPPLNGTPLRITQAALDLFAEHGFNGATTDAIARRANVTEKTLFRHFGSKKRLFAETVYPAMLRMLEPLAFDSLRTVLQSEYPTLRELLHSVITDRVAFNRKHPEILKLLAQGLLLHPDFRDAFASFWKSKMLPANKEMLRRARSRGELRKLPDEAVLRSIISLTAGFALNRLLFEPKTKRDDEKEVAIMVDILMDGINVCPKAPARTKKRGQSK